MNPAPEKPTSAEEYIDHAPKDAQKRLREMRACLLKAAPGATESLKWSVPAISYRRIFFTYANFKYHLSLFPTPAAIRAFAEELSEFKTSSSTIQFPLHKPLPVGLIGKIARFRVKECEKKDALWL